MNSIIFKSNPEFYAKEESGVKNNTVRIEDLSDERFILLERSILQGFPLSIKIVNNKTFESFTRVIQDISNYQGLVVITWRHTD